MLKVTDDRTCLKYKTESAPDMKKFERLNSVLMTKMQNRKESVGSEEGKLYGMFVGEETICKKVLYAGNCLVSEL